MTRLRRAPAQRGRARPPVRRRHATGATRRSTYALEDRAAAAAAHAVRAVRRARRGRRRVRRRRRRRVARRPRPVGPLARVPPGARGGARWVADATDLGHDQEQLRRPGAHRHRVPRRGGQDLPVRRRPVRPLLRRRLRPGRRGLPADDRRELGRRGAARRAAAGVRHRPSTRRSTAWTSRTYLFKGGRYAVVRRRPRRSRWRSGGGRCATPSRRAPGIDAAYTDGAGAVPAARRPDRPLRRLHRERRRAGRRGLPAAPGAALHGPARGVRERHRGRVRRAGGRPGVHLFKDGRTVSPAPGDRIVRRVDKRWGQLGPVLPSGHRRRRVRRPRRQDLPVQRRPVPALHRRGLLARRRGLPAADRRGLGRDDARGRRVRARRHGPTCSAPPGGCSAIPSPRSSSGPPTSAGSTRATSRPSCGNGCSTHGLRRRDGRAGSRARGPEWTVPLDGGVRVVVRARGRRG